MHRSHSFVLVSAIGATFAASGAVASPLLGDATNTLVINAGAPAPVHPSLYFAGVPRALLGGVDTYTAEPLVQDASSAFFLDDASGSVFDFDGLPEFGGVNATYAAAPVDMVVFESFTDLGATKLVQVEITAQDPTGAAVPWVSAAFPGLQSWRADVASTAAGGDLLTIPLGPGESLSIVDSGFSVFDSSGSGLATAPLTMDTSGASTLGGVAVAGLGGADIAGFDVASIQLFWEYEVVPAPASASMLALGGIALIRRRR